MEMLSDQLGEGSNAAGGGAEEKEKAEEDLEAAFNKPKKKSRWAEPAPILPIKPWQVGENCQALYSGIHLENIFVQECNVGLHRQVHKTPLQEIL